jgi:DNA repair protein RecO (recombination protein O)
MSGAISAWPGWIERRAGATALDIITDDALVLTILPHGEHGAVVRFLGLAQGLVAGHVHGARGRAKRAMLQPGNRVALTLAARVAGQLPTAQLELVQSRALLAFTPDTAAAVAWLSALVAAALPEGVPHAALAARLEALLVGMEAGQGWAEDLVRLETALLAEMGVGLDLASCALGGPSDDLAFVSPVSGRAVSRARAAGQPWERRLLPLPAFLGGVMAPAEARAVGEGLALTGHFLARELAHAWPRLSPLRDRLLPHIAAAS